MKKERKSIAAMGLVNREGDKFRVSTPSLRGKQTSYEVWRDEAGKIRCNCLEFEEAAVSDAGFRCEHILAVKYALVAKNTEPATKQPVTKRLKSSDKVKPWTQKLFQKTKAQLSRAMSARGEQKADEVQANVSDRRTSRNAKSSEPSQLANTQGEKKMTQENLKKCRLSRLKKQRNRNGEQCFEFYDDLRELRKNVDPESGQTARRLARPQRQHALRRLCRMAHGRRHFGRKRAELDRTRSKIFVKSAIFSPSPSRSRLTA